MESKLYLKSALDPKILIESSSQNSIGILESIHLPSLRALRSKAKQSKNMKSKERNKAIHKKSK